MCMCVYSLCGEILGLCAVAVGSDEGIRAQAKCLCQMREQVEARDEANVVREQLVRVRAPLVMIGVRATATVSVNSPA